MAEDQARVAPCSTDASQQSLEGETKPRPIPRSYPGCRATPGRGSRRGGGSRGVRTKSENKDGRQRLVKPESILQQTD